MNIVLDTRTLAYAISCTTAVIMLIMVYIRLTHRPHDSFILWTYAYALWTFSSVLFALRGSIPDLLSIVVMNLIRVGAYVILVNGLRRFFDQPPSRFNLVLYGALVLGLIDQRWKRHIGRR